MNNKKERTLEVYKKAGAGLRVVAAFLDAVEDDLFKILTDSELKDLDTILNRLEDLSFAAEMRMFDDFPFLSREYQSVFTGMDFFREDNSVDSEILKLAKEIVKTETETVV